MFVGFGGWESPKPRESTAQTKGAGGEEEYRIVWQFTGGMIAHSAILHL